MTLLRAAGRALAPAFAALLLGTGAAAGQAAPASASLLGDLWNQDTLLGNWGGVRDRFGDQGIILAADSIDEVLGVASGGSRTGTAYNGRVEITATIDRTSRLAGPTRRSTPTSTGLTEAVWPPTDSSTIS